MNQIKPLIKRKIREIRLGNFLIASGFYLLFSYLYHVTLCLNTYDRVKSLKEFFSFSSFMELAGLQYFIKFFLAVPIWWLIFIYLKSHKLSIRLLCHAVTLPLWVIISQQIHYSIADKFELTHLTGFMSIWDIYIPILFYILQFGLLHAYEYYRNSQSHLKREAALKQASLKSELSALKAQLNPHFLYNAFNTISASVPPENEQTRELIAQLADIFRHQLKSSLEEQITLKEEITFLTKYLSIEKARFEERLDFAIEVPKHLLNRKVPTMFLQPIIENSLKHGIAPMVSGGKITLKIEQINGHLTYEISDTGVGVENTNTLFDKGIGLTNTKLRLEKMYQTKLIIEHNDPSGLKVSFTI